jgi:hypothetical protein
MKLTRYTRRIARGGGGFSYGDRVVSLAAGPDTKLAGRPVDDKVLGRQSHRLMA